MSGETETEHTATRVTRRRYDRRSRSYDLMEWLPEHLAFASWRAELWSQVRGPRVLEVGVGTGKNMAYYPPAFRVTAVDLSDGMLSRARALARRLGVEVDLRQMDVKELAFPDRTFDSVVGTFVFCSVPDPVRGLREIRRVLRPGGRLLLVEHVLSHAPVLGRLMNLVNPLVVRMMGANINRETRRNIEAAGFIIEKDENLWRDVVKLFVAF